MTRNLKAMGLALLGVFALGAVGAQGAGAVVEHTFTTDSKGGTILTGTSEGLEEFKLTNSFFKCQDITYRGFQNGNSDHVAVYPIFGDGACESNIGAATIHNNGCTYTFDSETDHYPHFPAGETHAGVSLACGHTGSITVTTGGCTWHVSTTHTNGVIVNHNLPGVRYDVIANHSGGKSALTVTTTVRTTKVETTGANCPLLGLGANGTHINGTWQGQAIVTCYEGNSFNPHTQSAVEGALANCGLSTP